MTDNKYEKYKEALIAEHDRLITDLKEVAFQDDENPSDWVPRRDSLNISDGESVEAFELAEEIEKYESNTATTKELESRLNDILAALGRIEAGTYGIDEISGEPIPADRLAANPAARSVVANSNSTEGEATTKNELD